MYVVQVLVIHNLDLQSHEGNGSLNVSVTLKMHNPHGYLSAVDYPALVVSTAISDSLNIQSWLVW